MKEEMMTGQEEFDNRKKELRSKMKAVRDAISEEERKQQNEAITNIILNTELYEAATSILTYVSYGSEVDTRAIMQRAIRDGKRVYVPKVMTKSRKLEFFLCQDMGSLKKGYHGILEPETDPTKLYPYRTHISLDSSANCMVLVPGLAFDEKLGRIGYGGGYYDRYLSSFHKRMTIGMSYKEQIVDEVPMGPEDVAMDLVVTPERAYF